jgi:signal transduction histidine kinase
MTQVREDLRQRVTPTWFTVKFVVAVTCGLALASIASLVLLQDYRSSPLPFLDPAPWWLLAVFFVLAALSDVVYVPVRHADAWEELTFVEVVLIWGLLLLIPPVELVLTALVGFFVAEVLARRQLIKTVFNLASHAVAATGLITTYLLMVGDASTFSLRSVIAVTAGAIVFTGLNLIMLSMVLRAAQNVPPREFIAEQWVLSLAMAVGSVGIAMMALAIEQHTPLLLPFAALPILAMWYAYRASAAHADARERSRWLVQLGQAVSSPSSADVFIPQAADSLRRIYAADDYAVRLGDGRRFGADWPNPVIGEAEAVRLRAGELPTGWSQGVAVRMDSQTETGVLAIGTREQVAGRWHAPWARRWEMPETEIPALIALTSAVSNALRAGQTLSALTAETAKLQAVVDHATDGICVVDGEGQVLLWSPAAQRITGVADPHHGVADIVTRITATPAGQRGHALDFERADGQTVSLQVIRVNVYGSAATSVITIRDMTRERRAERLKSDFIATISHELRTPITPIRGYADLLKRRWDRMSVEKRESVLDTIEERADHLARLVDDLLIAARADTDSSLRVETSTVDLVEVVAEAASGFPEIDGRLEISPSPPRMVIADRTRVIQIISNLVGNALKYTPEGSPIEIRFDGEAPMVTVEVTDHGPGIAGDEQERVFERFYRIEDPLTMRTGGSGLGLHISRQLARAMGGDVTLRSSPGQGSTFILRLRAEG